MLSPLSKPVLDTLRRLETCAVCNAIESFGIRLRNEGFTHSSIRCLTPELGAVVGHAATVRIRCAAPPPDGHPYLDRTDWWQHVLTIPEPRIVVVEDLDEAPGLGALVGGVHAAILTALGCVGAITNGAFRDIRSGSAPGFHLFAAHLAVSHAYCHIVEFGVPVTVGGLRVHPGDLLHGDRHGVVNVPRELAADLPSVVAASLQHERSIIQFCSSPAFSLDGLRRLL
jgi:regulator of RNase E activity RraA